MASSSLSHLDASPAFSRMLSAAACSLSVLRLLHLGAEEGPARRGLSRLLRTEPPCWWSEPLVRSGCTSAACSRPRRAASSRRWPSPTTTRRARRPRPRCCSPPRVVHAGGRARLPGGRTRRAVPCHGPSCCRAAGALLFAPRARPCRLERLPLLGLSRAARPRRARRRCWRALPFPPLCAVPSRAICCRAAWQPCAAFAACTAWVHWFAWRAVPATSVPAHLPRPPPRRACAACRGRRRAGRRRGGAVPCHAYLPPRCSAAGGPWSCSAPTAPQDVPEPRSPPRRACAAVCAEPLLCRAVPCRAVPCSSQPRCLAAGAPPSLLALPGFTGAPGEPCPLHQCLPICRARRRGGRALPTAAVVGAAAAVVRARTVAPAVAFAAAPHGVAAGFRHATRRRSRTVRLPTPLIAAAVAVVRAVAVVPARCS